MKFRKSAPLKGEITVPGDKSISHRSVMLGAISKGTTSITSHFKRHHQYHQFSGRSRLSLYYRLFPENGDRS